MSFQQLVRVTRNAQDKLAGTEVQQSLIAPHVLLLGQAGQNPKVVFIITLLIPTKPEIHQEG